MRVWVLGSGSSGNATLLEADGTRVLIDAGIGPRNAVDRLRKLGVDLFPRSVDAILVTHEHGDHCAQLEPLARATHAPVLLHAGISAPRVRARFPVREYRPGVPFDVGAFVFEAVAVPHDARQVAVFASGGGRKFAVVTDLGAVPAGLDARLRDCDMALVEANYCPEMLAQGPYPWRLKQRVGGGLGHLSNHQTAALAARLAHSRLATLWLGHISRNNNLPARALEIVRERSPSLDVRLVDHGVPTAFTVERGPGALTQLSLAWPGCPLA
jgi:phosphoribosyl 1,2-cyclic phosphodiesterase